MDLIQPNAFRDLTNNDRTLSSARQWVREARVQKIGLFEAHDPLRLEPFEVRFLARRRPPNRWVVDLSQTDNVLIKSQAYYTVPNVEDRLFIPGEYVPLFVEAGWQRQV